ncbi:uncharacterized protein OCT59_015882 [Rhizophagus irregularis]|uniref:Mkk2p n=2 Tax=Rhizophagus irregularis TaxID=588596 RepID=A0A015MCJ5_RHIIW|nr:Mkk2p [Rhizophagus irregularis DAOM 197198w]UZO23548.1 hypothetical protein OCT59_015882 [Rhizophagus irregularis]GBC30734.1 kinase-like domain-containing protein [Rhizophagus irregularis DAOM 181602=DAOM 197198]
MRTENEAIAPFISLVRLVFTLTKEIIEAYENVQCIKRTCGTLVNRVKAAGITIKVLMREKEKYLENFRDENYYNTFLRFTNCLKQIKKLFDDVSQLHKFIKFISSASIEEKFEEIIKEFNTCSNDLNLTIYIATQNHLNNDLKILHNDMIEMYKFLQMIECGITDTANNNEITMNKLEIQNNEIKFIAENIVVGNERLIEMNEELDGYKKVYKTINYLLNMRINEQDSIRAKDIKASELQDPPKYVPLRLGSRVKIQKKVFNAIEVACKPIPKYIFPMAQKYLATLEKLGACPYIIKFHGLSVIATVKVIVIEWAEYGTLRDVYQNYKINWGAKISIARDICCGLAFLQSVNILHHDIRCENVLINEKIQPKLCNFSFPSEYYEKKILYSRHNITNWAAPELFNFFLTDQNKKFRKSGVPKYTIKCEIFSFGMLLWELAFQEIPYKNMSIIDIEKLVSKGYREALNLGLNSYLIKEYCEIIKLSWQQDPSLRPGIQSLFNKLQGLYEKNILKYKGTTVDVPLFPVKVGLEAHKDGNYKKAWDIFETNADVGDMLAKYWKGYYYLVGIYINKNKSKAMKLFKKAADAGNADAQLRYAFCLINKENKNINAIEFMKYLQLAADNNNAAALYNVGDIYFSGKLGIKRDKEKGIYYLRQAALRKHARAKETLDKNNISIEY